MNFDLSCQILKRYDDLVLATLRATYSYSWFFSFVCFCFALTLFFILGISILTSPFSRLMTIPLFNQLCFHWLVALWFIYLFSCLVVYLFVIFFVCCLFVCLLVYWWIVYHVSDLIPHSGGS